MSIRAKSFTYVGKHCFSPCLKSRRAEMCQCKFDRNYERESFEGPPKRMVKKVTKAKKNVSKKAKTNPPTV